MSQYYHRVVVYTDCGLCWVPCVRWSCVRRDSQHHGSSPSSACQRRWDGGVGLPGSRCSSATAHLAPRCNTGRYPIL